MISSFIDYNSASMCVTHPSKKIVKVDKKILSFVLLKNVNSLGIYNQSKI